MALGAAAMLAVGLLAALIWYCRDAAPPVPLVLQNGGSDAAVAAGTASAAPDATTAQAGDRMLAIAAAAAEPAAELLVHVRTDQGAPVPDVRVRVVPQPAFNPWLEERLATTDAAGTVRLQLPPDDYLVSSSRGGSSAASVRRGAVEEVWLRIASSYSVEGSVVDTKGAPVAQAALWLSRTDSQSRGEIAGRSDRGGRFRLEVVVGDRLLGAVHPDFAPTALQAIGGGASETVRVQLVMHAAHGSISGTVVDARGEAIADALILIGNESGSRGGDITAGPRLPPPPVLVRSDAQGHFASPALEPGPQQLSVRKPGFGGRSLRCEVRVATTTPVRIELVGGGRVHGTVRRQDGAPAALARVWCGARGSFACVATTTDADGSYRLDGLPAGEQQLTAEDRDGQRQSEVRQLLADDEVEWNPVLVQPAAVAALRGVLLDHRRQPLIGWRIAAIDQGTDGIGITCSSRAGGQFELPQLQPGTVVQLRASRRDRAAGAMPDATLDHVIVGPEPVEFVVADPSTDRGTLYAAVVDPDGNACRASLDIWHLDRRCFGHYAAETGQFAIELPAGRLQIEVHGEALPTEHLPPCPVPAGASIDLGTIKLRPAAIVFGRVYGPGGGALTGMTVRVLCNGEIQSGVDCAAGSYRSGPLAPGSYVVLAQADGCAPQRQSLELVAGEQRELDCSLAAGVVARIRVDVPRGADVGNAVVVAALGAGDALLWQGGLRLDKGEREGQLWLGEGSYRIVVFGRRGWRGEAALQVAASVPLQPVAIALHRD